MSVRMSRLTVLLTLAPCTLALSGCVENLPDVSAFQGDVRSTLTKGAISSPRGATMAIASLEGGPSDVETRFQQSFNKEAADREIVIADALSAHYLVRGYLNAYAADHGTDIAYVYDIFDANSQTRVGRVDDVLTVPGAAPNVWTLVNDEVIASLAGRSADSLAATLAATPEARAAAAVISTANAASTATAHN